MLASPPKDLSAPALSRAHYWMGKIAESSGNTANAREQYQRALDANAKHRLAREALERLK